MRSVAIRCSTSLFYQSIMKKIVLFIAFFLFAHCIHAQTGISVSPPRIYFESESGVSNTEKITITNVSEKNTLDLAVSLGDWEYDEKGENMMYVAGTLPTSCASWITVKKEDAYFSLSPGERRDISITLTAPDNFGNLAAHTAVLYVSQMNPVDDVDSNGANIKVSIRSGIKIFHKIPNAKNKKIEITNLKFDQKKNALTLFFENQSNIWVDGKVTTDIINSTNGKKITIDPVIFYTMPGNKRELQIPLTKTPEKGSYTASVLMDYGDSENLELGELNFNYE